MNIDIKNTSIPRQRVIGAPYSTKRLKYGRGFSTSDLSEVSSVLTISRNKSKPPRIEECASFWFSTDKLRKRARMVPVLGHGALKLNPFGDGGALFTGTLMHPTDSSYDTNNYYYPEEVVETLQSAHPDNDLLPVARHAAATLVLDNVMNIEPVVEAVETTVSTVCGKHIMMDTIPLTYVWV
jgi:hypothetical protein